MSKEMREQIDNFKKLLSEGNIELINKKLNYGN
jgi:hypothetical protein